MKDHRRPNESADDVARLLRLAGRRESVPEERMKRARVAAQAAWRREVRQRTRRRGLWVAAAAAVAASVVLAVTFGLVPMGGGSIGSSVAINIESVSGAAWVRSPQQPTSQPRKLSLNDRVPPGSELITRDEGRLAVRLDSGHSVRLDHSTTVRWIEDDELELVRGAVYLDSGVGAEPARKIELYTPFGRVEEIGTQFEVRLGEGSVLIRLREGAVILHHEEGRFPVAVQTELELQADGSMNTREISTHGPEWGWIEGITPMLDLEGQTARSFLDWVARERGWTLAFADEAAARAAGETVVVGRISGMTIEEALQAVLPSSRLSHRLNDGVLIIDEDSVTQ